MIIVHEGKHPLSSVSFQSEVKHSSCLFSFQRLEAKLQSQMDYEEIKTELR